MLLHMHCEKDELCLFMYRRMLFQYVKEEEVNSGTYVAANWVTSEAETLTNESQLRFSCVCVCVCVCV